MNGNSIAQSRGLTPHGIAAGVSFVSKSFCCFSPGGQEIGIVVVSNVVTHVAKKH